MKMVNKKILLFNQLLLGKNYTNNEIGYPRSGLIGAEGIFEGP
jgi:hypothetical protein